MTHVRFNNRECMSTRHSGSDVNDFFNQFWSGIDRSYGYTHLPPANIIEADDHFRIELSVPGLEKKDFSIKVEGYLLTISYEPEMSTDQKNERFSRKEFAVQPFKRSFRLSNWVDSESIRGRYESGILILEIPKKEEAKSKPSRVIEIG